MDISGVLIYDTAGYFSPGCLTDFNPDHSISGDTTGSAAPQQLRMYLYVSAGAAGKRNGLLVSGVDGFTGPFCLCGFQPAKSAESQKEYN